MEVLIVSGSYPPETGGIGELMKGFADALSNQGIGVSVLTSADGAEEFSTEGIPVTEFRLPKTGYFRRVFACRKAVRQLLAKNSFDRVLASSWSPFAVGLAPLRTENGVPVDIFCHGMDLLEPARSRRYRVLIRRTLRSSATTIANSNFTAGVALKLGAPTGQVLILNPGINVERYAPGDRPEAISRGLGIGPENRVLLSLSRLVPRKGFDLILRALPRVLESHPSTVYVIAGDGPDRGRLEKLTASLGLGDRVRFAGPVSAGELPHYYRLADLFVMPSRYIEKEGDVEGFGIVFLEAALSAVASIGGRSGGIPDAIVHGETGLLVDPESEIECAAAIVDLLADNERLTQMGQKARERAISQFSWTTIVAKYLTWVA